MPGPVHETCSIQCAHCQQWFQRLDNRHYRNCSGITDEITRFHIIQQSAEGTRQKKRKFDRERIARSRQPDSLTNVARSQVDLACHGEDYDGTPISPATKNNEDSYDNILTSMSRPMEASAILLEGSKASTASQDHVNVAIKNIHAGSIKHCPLVNSLCSTIPCINKKRADQLLRSLHDHLVQGKGPLPFHNLKTYENFVSSESNRVPMTETKLLAVGSREIHLHHIDNVKQLLQEMIIKVEKIQTRPVIATDDSRFKDERVYGQVAWGDWMENTWV